MLARVLVRRGIDTAESASRFLNPSVDHFYDPTLLPDFEPASKAILGAKERKERIFVHGDYDVDGMTSTALLTRFLAKIGCDVVAHVPHRMKEGYGIAMSAIPRAKEAGASLFLTCDCGISAHDQVIAAREAGMRVVVTDHHELHETLPEAEAVVNPHRPDSPYPFDTLSGVGVALKLCAGLAQESGLPLPQFYRAYLDLASLGTVADVMPLIDENRTIVALGVKELGSSRKVGLQALMRLAIPDWQPGKPVTARDIGFKIAPRLNSVGRIDDAASGLKLLLESDLNAAQEIARELEQHNYERRAEQDRMLEQAFAMVDENGYATEPVIVIGSEGWHRGIVGLVAGRVVEKYGRPTFAISLNEDGGRASGRSLPGYHMADALHRIRDLLTSHGGHELAAGFGFERDKFESVVSALREDARIRVDVSQLIPVKKVDAEIDPAELTLEAVKLLEKMAPFGSQNHEPLLLFRNAEIAMVRSTKNPAVAQFEIKDRKLQGITFNLAEKILAEWKQGERYDLLVHAVLDTYQGIPKVKLQLVDYRPATA